MPRESKYAAVKNLSKDNMEMCAVTPYTRLTLPL